MPYHHLRHVVADLLKTGQMVQIEEPVDTYLEIAAIQRRIFERNGPALYFSNVYSSCSFDDKGKQISCKRISGQRIPCSFPMISNLFGSRDRLEFLFKGAIEPLKEVIQLGADPIAVGTALLEKKWNWRQPLKSVQSSYLLFKTLYNARPKSVRSGPVLQNITTLDRLPQLVSWSEDGGPFITLPQVYTEQAGKPGLLNSNLGMYRVQIAGNQYRQNKEAGLHYQIHRGIAAHHAAAIQQKRPLAVNVFIGGSPAMTLAAIMPLPENVSELTFAGMLGQRRIPMIPAQNGQADFGEPTEKGRKKNPAILEEGTFLPTAIYADADFCLCGYLDQDRVAPEGPFGDHLGYYSLQHDFPVFHVEKVYHRNDAIWPFTVVGQPPQEDSVIGQFIHELVGDAIPKKIPGVHAVHAVDEAGVHPLLLAIGSERYHPYDLKQRNRSAELHTLASAILGCGQLSLAKYLFLLAHEDDPSLSVKDVPYFFQHLLRRVDFMRDLHFTTQTNADSLDYSGGEIHRGSKLVLCATGSPIRELPGSLEEDLLPCFNRAKSEQFSNPQWVLPGILTFSGPMFANSTVGTQQRRRFLDQFRPNDPINRFPLIVLLDEKANRSTFRDFLWNTFTKSDPAKDVDGIGALTVDKHWGCQGSLVIDARTKPHHAPELVENAQVAERANQILARIGY